ncbi:MAG: LEA type 2 family protein [Steroidobacteraceae bacterium]
MFLRGALACLAISMLGGCVLVPKFKEPKLDVVDVQMLRGDLLQQELRVRMVVRNPNNRELSVRSIQYQVQVAGEAFAHGESERDFKVPANGETQFDVSVTANAAAAVLRLLGSGRRLDAVEYQITGKLTLASGLMRSIPFDQKGQIHLR